MQFLKDKNLWHPAALINGEWVTETPHGTYDLRNPATGELLAKLPRCQEEEVTKAIESADAAFRKWRETTPKQRGRDHYPLVPVDGRAQGRSGQDHHVGRGQAAG